MVEMAYRTAENDVDGTEDSRGRIVKMAQRTAEDGRDAHRAAGDGENGRKKSNGWLERHTRQHRMLWMEQRKANDVGDGTEDRYGWQQ